MGVSALVHINFDLLSVGVAVSGIALLGALIYLGNPRSVTNRTFLAFAVLTAAWGLSNYAEYRFDTALQTLWALRFHLFISVWHALLFFQLAYVFPRESFAFPRWYRYALVPSVMLVSILTLTSAVFSGVPELADPGFVTNPERGPGIALFAGLAFGLLIFGTALLLRRALRAKAQERTQLLIVFAGMFLSACLILVFNVVLPVIFDQLSFIPLAALFILPFVGLIFYAISRHHLFDLKTATTAVLGFMVTAFSLANVVYSTSPSAVAINVTAFVIVLLGSLKIVRDTHSLNRLADELRQTTERQEGLIHFLGHEVKGFLTKDEGAFAALDEGDFGALPDNLKPFVERALAQTRDGVRSVTDILKAANQKKGTIEYKKESFDLRALAAETVEKARPNAEAKGLKLSFVAEGTGFDVVGDRAELGDHVIRNLVENAVNYTPSGSITAVLRHENGKLVFSVKDTGVGISEEDKKRLFTEGGHGKDSQTINVHSTGYGLYIAKNVTEAHGGTIRAESEGPGKGSTFIVEFPA